MGIQKGEKLMPSLDEIGVRRAVEKYTEHLRAGGSKLFFYYRDDDGYHCNHETLERYLKKKEFEAEANLVKEAELAGLNMIYGLGMRMVKGGKDVINCSPKTWETIMRNKGRKYGWDKEAMSQNSDIRVWLKAPDKKDENK
ncbi:MAG: hypothetical protein ACE5GV_00280 [Candidatus Scalindua sp.]